MEKRESNMRPVLILAAVLGFLAVALGAFGAHGLKESLGPEKMAIFETGNRYHFYHTFAVFLSAILYFIYQKKQFLFSAYLFIFGIFIFSGSLYALSITGVRMLGVITPIGGILFLFGWANLSYTFFRFK